MNIPPTPTPTAATTSLAGVSRAAARGGEHENRTSEAARQQRASEAPAGKSADSASIDANEATGDRGGDGRQTYDHFEKQERNESEAKPESDSNLADSPVAPSEHIDFEA